MNKNEIVLIDALSKYFPYGIDIEYSEGNGLAFSRVYSLVKKPNQKLKINSFNFDDYKNLKLLLRPFSELFKTGVSDKQHTVIEEIIYDCEIPFCDDDTYEKIWYDIVNRLEQMNLLKSKIMLSILYKYHFDVEALTGKGLIEQGLAVSLH